MTERDVPLELWPVRLWLGRTAGGELGRTEGALGRTELLDPWLGATEGREAPLLGRA